MSIIVPVYNEEKTIIPTLVRLGQIPFPVSTEVIVVNDGSTDGTRKLLEQNPSLYTNLILMSKNGGKGAAVRQALMRATGEFVVFQDADLEYNPYDLLELLDSAKKDNNDIVMGSRFLSGARVKVVYSSHTLGNRILTACFNGLYFTKFSDVYSCYLLFRRSLINPNQLISDGWEQHAEILCRCIVSAQRYRDIPIEYFGRTRLEGKKIRPHHALLVLKMMLHMRLKFIFLRIWTLFEGKILGTRYGKQENHRNGGRPPFRTIR